MLAIENEIPVFFIERSGKPVGRIWSPKYGSISTIRKGQLLFSQSPYAVQWIKEELAQKISNQQAMLLMLPAQKSAKTNDFRSDSSEYMVSEVVKKLSDLKHIRLFF